jgi:hypothetical protein
MTLRRSLGYLVVALCMLAGVVCGSPLFADTILSYDPTETYGGHAWGQQRIASEMTMPSGSGSSLALQTFSVNVHYTNAATTPITVSVWADSSGQIGSLLYSKGVSDVNPGWNNFDISDLGIQLNAGQSVFVGYTASQTDASNIGVGWSQQPAIGKSYETNPFYPDFSSNPWEYFTVSGTPADWVTSVTVTPTPEPSTIALLATGALSLTFMAWRRRKRS